MVRIQLSPAESLLRTAGEGARPELGQTFKLTPDQRTDGIRRRDRGEPLSDIARSYKVHPSTICELCRVDA